MNRSRTPMLQLFAGLMFLVGTNAGVAVAQDNKPSTHADANRLDGPSAVAVANLEEKDFADFHEDLTSVKLDTRTLELKLAMPGPRAAFANCDLQTVRLKWRPNDSLDLYICIPKGVEKPPVIVYLYGYPFNEKRYSDDGWYARTTDMGYATIAFFPALSGPRLHSPRPLRQNFLSQLPETLAMTAHDTQMVINYLSTRKDLNLDLDRLGIFATSFGATAAILAAAADSRIKAIDLLNPWGDWPDWVKKSELLGFVPCETCSQPEFLQNLAPLDPVKWLPTLTTPYIRIRHFVENGETPRIAQDRMEAVVAKSAKVVRYENVAAFNRSAVGGKTFDWIKAALQVVSSGKPGNAAEKPSTELSRDVPGSAQVK